jgi:cytochrome c oxidase cbb3-type subunit III
MRAKFNLLAGGLVLLASVAVRVGAQQPPPPQAPPPTQAPPPAGQGAGAAGAGAPQGRGRGPGTFPAQQRALADPAVIARGQALYGSICRACHGVDLRGGDMGGPNLLRSPITLADQDGESIGPVIRSGRQNPGMPVMPPLDLPEADLKAVSAYVRSVLASARGQGAPPAGPPIVLNIVVGDRTAGEAYFKTKCTACHSATGDLAGLATRVADPMALQNLWVAGGGRGRGAGAAPGTPNRREVTVTVTTPSETVTGRLTRVDDFLVILTLADGQQRSFRRNGDTPKVVINDPLEPHRKLLSEYTDKDMHNVTAYLVTLK